MKTTYQIIAIIVSLSFLVSCNNDSEEQLRLGLIGTWIEFNRTTTNCSTPSQNGTTTCANICQTYKFTETSVTWSSPNDLPINGIYSATNTMINITMDNGSPWSPITYKIESNKLTLTYRDGTCTATEVYNRI